MSDSSRQTSEAAPHLGLGGMLPLQETTEAAAANSSPFGIQLDMSAVHELPIRTSDPTTQIESSSSSMFEDKDLEKGEGGPMHGSAVVLPVSDHHLPRHHHRGGRGAGGGTAEATPISSSAVPFTTDGAGLDPGNATRSRKRTLSRIASSMFLDKLHQFQTYQSAADGTPHRESSIGDDGRRFNALLEKIQSKFPRIGRGLLYLRGPSPPWIETAVRPLWSQGELFFNRKLAFMQRRRRFITPIFLLVWLIAFVVLVRESFFNSRTNVGTPEFILGTSSFWSKDDGCGLNATGCAPFINSSLVFRCPSQTLDVELLNNRAVGDQEIIFQSLVVGGGDAQSTYRADSWICASAIHHGLFGNRKGGCGRLEMVGEFTGFVGVNKNGVGSVSFDSTFPSSYRFVDTVTQQGCRDIRDEILGFDVAMSTIFSFVIRPEPAAFFWTLLCMGFWHVVLASDPSAMPPNLERGFKFFLPTLFIGYVIWRTSFRWVVPAFEAAAIERTVWYLGGFWVGLLINLSLAWIPIIRLTASDIAKQPGSLVAVIVLALVIFFCVLNQLRIIRRTGWFYFYIFWYLVGGCVIGLLTLIPTLEFRLHHYFLALIFLPGCAFVTRPSALFQGLLLGIFLDGAGRWGFDSILQAASSLVGDGSTGSALPTYLTSATNFTSDQASIFWNAIPDSLANSWDGFSLLVDDVERYSGTATNYSIAWLNDTIPHYFRLAYTSSGKSGDFARAATAFISNGTWIDPASGTS
ncbi:BQ5605_C018g08594 [Microbotryum silenes-dioicae]|uniref:BQ5605_C018g08594 protein n=1 Tax=Microbotryum silenes-dioicae TaxID=796604 RepID=A0A2X0MRD6_9BASI|nr:BQ5605_C018g08594 [Microbotryum silenes-dioicae]